MREELRRNNSIGTIDGINRFLDLVFVRKTFGVEALQQAFRYYSLAQFNCHLAIVFFEELKLIKSSHKEIKLTEQGIDLSCLSVDEQKGKISELIFHYLLSEKMINCERITVDSLTGELRIPTNAFSLSAAIYRNFLYEIGFFSKSGIYFSIINKQLHTLIEKEIANTKKKMSQDQLLLRLQKQQADGEAGELFVLEYEKRRLSQHHPVPKRISLVDVGAGYDILSCHDKDSILYDRYIEVKSFRGKPHFYWSANEKRIAEVLGEDYFLYLVDLDKMGNESNEYAPTIIQNPANQLLGDGWLIEPDSFKITRIV